MTFPLTNQSCLVTNSLHNSEKQSVHPPEGYYIIGKSEDFPIIQKNKRITISNDTLIVIIHQLNTGL